MLIYNINTLFIVDQKVFGRLMISFITNKTRPKPVSGYNYKSIKETELSRVRKYTKDVSSAQLPTLF